MKKLSKLFKPCTAVFLLILLIFSASLVKESCYKALNLCAQLLIPSLFPFFVLSAFITRLGLPGILGAYIAPFLTPIYGISPAGASAIIMGLIGGYPSGAAYIAELTKNKLVSSDEAERLIAFCNNSGPAFVIGVMGCSIFGSTGIGIKLYLVHIFSALLTGLFFRLTHSMHASLPHYLHSAQMGEALVYAVKQAVNSILNVCGFVISFSVFITLLDCSGAISKSCAALSLLSGVKTDTITAAINGILELGNGSSMMQGLEKSPLNLSIAASMLGWGGLSVHFQTLAVLSESKIKGTLHLTGRLLSAMISFVAMYLISC